MNEEIDRAMLESSEALTHLDVLATAITSHIQRLQEFVLEMNKRITALEDKTNV